MKSSPSFEAGCGHLTVEDYETLLKLLVPVERAFVTPNTLTETSNLLAQHGEPERSSETDKPVVFRKGERKNSMPPTPIPGNTDLKRAEYAIQTINDYLPSEGEIRSPTGTSPKVRFALRHDALRSMTRPRQHPRVVATFACSEVPSHTYSGRLSYYHKDPVTARHIQVLVPVLGKAVGLSDDQVDRNGDPVTYVSTIEEVQALATAIARAMS